MKQELADKLLNVLNEYHSMGGDFSAARGELRKLNVTAGIGGESCMSYQKVPTKVLKEDKAEYIQALKDSREEENVDVFINCMTKLHVQHLQSDIDQFVKSTTEKVVDKQDLKRNLVDKWSIKPSLAEKLVDILTFAADKDVVTTEMIVGQYGFAVASAKRYLRQLTEFGYLTAQGGNKNRTYKKVN